MARPVRVNVRNGWYHITARGIERRCIFPGRAYYLHFLELLSSMSDRYTVELHAYCLMGHHYHLIIRTPQANASEALQWLNVSYSAWFNRKQQRVGHLFQGRFASKLIENDGCWLLTASVYLHLNPVRTTAQGLDRRGRKAEGRGLKEPTRTQIQTRLANLRDYRWSMFGTYAGYRSGPKWLNTRALLCRGGGRTAYRELAESYVWWS